MTNQRKSWICKGSSAWQDGYLVSPELAQDCKESMELADTVPDLQAERTELQKQRDKAMLQAQSLNLTVTALNMALAQAQRQRDALQKEVQDKWTTGQIVKVSLVTLGVGILVGGGTAVYLAR